MELPSSKPIAAISLPEAPKDPCRAAFESAVPGATYAGHALSNPNKKRIASDQVFTKQLEGEDLEKVLDCVVENSPNEWKTIALLGHEAGIEYGAARRLKWEQVGKNEIRWTKVGGSGGDYRVEMTPLLREHLGSLERSAEFVCPRIALMEGPWGRAEFRKVAVKHLRPYQRYLRRFSPWAAIVERHDCLAREGKKPAKLLVPGARDLKAYVRARLQGIRAGTPPTGEDTGSPCFNQYRALSVEELTQLAAKLEDAWFLILLVQFYLFPSLEKLCQLTWEDFDLESGKANLPGRKGTPLHPCLLAFLRGIPGTKAGKLVPWTNEMRVRHAAMRAFQEAGVKDPRVRLTSIRRTTVFLLKAKGIVVTPKGKLIIRGKSGDKALSGAEKLKLLKSALDSFPDLIKARETEWPLRKSDV